MITPDRAVEASLDVMEKHIDRELSCGIFYVHLPYGRHISVDLIKRVISRYTEAGWQVEPSDRREQVIDPHFALRFSPRFTPRSP